MLKKRLFSIGLLALMLTACSGQNAPHMEEMTTTLSVEETTAANTEEQKPEMENTWIENLGKYLLDISKFVTTGVVIASQFKDMDDSATIYVVGTIVAVSTLIVGLVLTNKTRKGGIELWECILFSSFTAYRASYSCCFA